MKKNGAGDRGRTGDVQLGKLVRADYAKALPCAGFPWERRASCNSGVQCISLIFTRFHSRTVTRTVTRIRADRSVEAGEGARLRPAHPAAVNPEQHFERRVPEHAPRRAAVYRPVRARGARTCAGTGRQHASSPWLRAGSAASCARESWRDRWSCRLLRGTPVRREAASAPVAPGAPPAQRRSFRCRARSHGVLGSPKPNRRCTVRLMRIRPCSKSMEFQASASASLGRMPVKISAVRKARSQPCAASMIRSASAKIERVNVRLWLAQVRDVLHRIIRDQLAPVCGR